jgi:hypothetical protein
MTIENLNKILESVGVKEKELTAEEIVNEVKNG